MEEKIDSAEKELILLESRKKEIIRGLSLLLLIIPAFLILRIILELLGSNPISLFTGFVYLISGIFLLPFWGIFPQSHNTPTTGKLVFDSAAFIALFCYIFLILLAMVVVWLITKMLKTGKQVEETVEKDNPVDPTKSEQVVK